MAACSICTRPDVAAVNAALQVNGSSNRDVARRFPPATKDAIGRHRAHVGAPPSPPTPPKHPGARQDKPRGAAMADTRETRVRHIMALMAARQWEADMSERYAAEWKIGVSSVRDYAGEAGRRVTAVDEPEWVRTRISTALDRLLARAEALADAGDAKAIQAGASVLKVWTDHARGAGGGPIEAAPLVFKVELSAPERPPAEEPGKKEP